MLQSLSHHTTMAQAPLKVPVSPTFIIQGKPYDEQSVPYDYDPALGVLAYRQPRDPAGPPIQFVFPTKVDGYAITVEVVAAPDAGKSFVEAGQIFLPPVAMYQKCTIQISVTPPPAATEGKVAKPKIKIDIIVAPTGGG